MTGDEVKLSKIDASNPAIRSSIMFASSSAVKEGLLRFAGERTDVEPWRSVDAFSLSLVGDSRGRFAGRGSIDATEAPARKMSLDPRWRITTLPWLEGAMTGNQDEGSASRSKQASKRSMSCSQNEVDVEH